MASLEEHRLDGALRRGLKGIEGLPESVRFADEAINRYLRERFGEVLLSEYRRRSDRGEDETAIREHASQIMDAAVLDAKKVYELFELHMKSRSSEFWQRLDPEGRATAAGSRVDPIPSTTEVVRAGFKGSFSGGGGNATLKVQRFLCTEGCELEGDSAYLAHRDRGHHPFPV